MLAGTQRRHLTAAGRARGDDETGAGTVTSPRANGNGRRSVRPAAIRVGSISSRGLPLAPTALCQGTKRAEGRQSSAARLQPPPGVQGVETALFSRAISSRGRATTGAQALPPGLAQHHFRDRPRLRASGGLVWPRRPGGQVTATVAHLLTIRDTRGEHEKGPSTSEISTSCPQRKSWPRGCGWAAQAGSGLLREQSLTDVVPRFSADFCEKAGELGHWLGANRGPP